MSTDVSALSGRKVLLSVGGDQFTGNIVVQWMDGPDRGGLSDKELLMVHEAVDTAIQRIRAEASPDEHPFRARLVWRPWNIANFSALDRRYSEVLVRYAMEVLEERGIATATP